MPPKMSGAKILLECLLKEGVEVVFGYPGGAVLPLYDELYRYRDKIKHVLVRHEQGGAHMADAYARVKKKAGVCIATSGPGATNLVTGIATAMMDSVPLIAITGNVSSHLLGSDAFQETDITGITQPIVKHSYLVTDPEHIAQTVKEAFYIATTGRQGPVHIDITKDAQSKEAIFRYPKKAHLPGYKSEPEVAKDSDIRRAIGLIKTAQGPVIIAGHGVIIAGAYEELKEFVSLTNIPVTNTLLGLSSFANDDRHYLGMLGMHGSAVANYTVADADLVIGVGIRFDDRITGDIESFRKGTQFIHFDIDPAEFNKNVPAHVPIGGDVKKNLARFNAHLKRDQKNRAFAWEQWWEKIDAWGNAYQFKKISKEDMRAQTSQLSREPHTDSAVKALAGRRLTTPEVVSLVSYITGGNAIVTTGVGQHQMYVAQYYQFNRPGSLVTSGGSGTMGYDLPSAIGARYAAPKDVQVWGFFGDGGFQMTMQELAVVSQERLDIKMIIINDGYLGMVKQWQDLFYGKRLSAVYLGNPDFVKLAGSYDIPARRVTTWQEAVRAILWAYKKKYPVLLDVWVSPNQHIYPMVSSGMALKDQFVE